MIKKPTPYYSSGEILSSKGCYELSHILIISSILIDGVIDYITFDFGKDLFVTYHTEHYLSVCYNKV